MMNPLPNPSAPRPAATVVLLRDGPGGVEAFMVTRRKDSRFMGGALVFPGGAVDPADAEAAHRWRQFDDAPFRLAAIRELFEEAGFLLACEIGTDALVSAERSLAVAVRWRRAVHAGEVNFAHMLEAEGLAPALSRLILFAHWITPPIRPLRFDTRFYAVMAPEDQLGRHDGTELVDSRWVTAAQAAAEADQGRVTLVFVTRCNLMLIDGHGSVAAVLALLATRRVEVVTPEVLEAAGGRILRIPVSAGYPVTEGALALG